MEGAVSQALVWDLASQKSSAVQLHMCLETLFRGLTLGLCSMGTGSTRQGKVRGLREGRNGPGSVPGGGGGIGAEMVVRPFGTEGFVGGLVCFAFASRSGM